MQKQYQWVQAVILFFAIFAIYVIKINHTAGIDEIMTFFKYTRSLPDITLYDAPNNHILHSFLVWLSTSVLGTSLLAIRLPAFMAGMISLPLLYRLGMRWGNHYIGMIAMLIIGITQDFFTYTVDGRGYTLTILFVILLVDNVSVLKINTSKYKAIYTFLLSLGIMLLIPSNAFFIAGIIGWQVIVAGYMRKPKLLINSVPYFLGGAISGLLYAVLLLTMFPDGLSQEFHVGFRNINGFAYQSVLTLFSNPTFDILLFPLFLWGITITFLQYRKPRFMLVACIFLAAATLSIAQWLVTQRLFFPRNFLYLTPLISIIIAIGIYRLSKFRLNFILFILLLIGGLVGIQTRERNPHITELLAEIDKNALEGDVLFVGAGNYDPIYYHIRVQNELARDYFMSTERSNRFVLIPTSQDIDSLISIHGLEPYIEDCTQTIWGSTDVLTCPIVNGTYSTDKSRCFVSIYPYWRKCGEEDKL